MIPKIIHYCWFGDAPKPESVLYCINSWKKYCPDYEIVEWNEDNVDLSACPFFVREAYARKKWAYVTDYIRLKVVYEHGGIYLDTDVELLKPLDELLEHELFMGCEGTQVVATGLGFGAEMGNCILRENMRLYEAVNPINETEEFVAQSCPYYTTRVLEQYGVAFPVNTVTKIPQEKGVIYPNEYFNPYDWKFDKLRITPNTYSIHHYDASWMAKGQKKSMIQEARKRRVEQRFGKTAAKVYEYIYWSRKENGGPGLGRRLIGRIRRK